MQSVSEPSYLALLRSGELQRRAAALDKMLAPCELCPRLCRVDRLRDEKGFCRSGRLPIVSSACDHHGEEPALSGSRGSGTIFFGNCNMRCLYCQNYQISQDRGHQAAMKMMVPKLAEKMLMLQNSLGCHNINLVSPTHFVPQIVSALVDAAAKGLRIPLVYNTGGYDSLEVIKLLDGVVDIYLPDLRYASDEWALKFSQARGYVAAARAAISEMHRQVGDLVVNDDGVAQRGLIVRHLILPNDIAGSRESLTWLAEKVSPTVTVSIMAQYYPAHRAPGVPLLSRRITAADYREVLDLVERLGLENGWIQEMSAPDSYRPDFKREGHPFTL